MHNGGYLNPSTLHLTRTSAALACSRTTFMQQSISFENRNDMSRGFVPALRRRHCSGNASTTQENAHKTPAAATAKTHKSGLEITAATRACGYCASATLRDTIVACGQTLMARHCAASVMGRTTGAFLFCATVTEPSCHRVNRRDPPAGLRELVVAVEDRHYGCPELRHGPVLGDDRDTCKTGQGLIFADTGNA